MSPTLRPRLLVLAPFLVAVLLAPAVLSAQPLLKSAINIDAGNTKATGATFGYRLTYNCSSTSGPCLGAEVVDLLPAEVQFVSTVPASPTGDVAAIQVTPNFGGTGRTQVRFDLVDPLPAGNSGDLIVNVRFPNGSTPDGTVATNTADAVNLETTPGTFTTPPVSVTATASVQVELSKLLATSPANLDQPERYRLRVRVPNSNGALQLTAVGPVTDTLPPGTVFDGATPAADCEPGCVGTTPATVTWSSPCSLPVDPNENCDIQVNVTFPSATFVSGSNVTNSFVVDATPLGEPPQSFGPGSVTHPVTTFAANASASFTKRITGPNPPTLGQTFGYSLDPRNNGNVPLDTVTLVDTLPVAMAVDQVTTGAYNGLAGPVTVSYETNLSGGFVVLGSSPAGTNASLPIPALGAGEYVTRLRWELGTASPGMAPTSAGNRPSISGRIVDPDNQGNPVAIGASIQNCADLSAVYSAGPTNVARTSCQTFTLSGPFVQLDPAKDNLSGGGPFNPGQTVGYRLRVRTASTSSDPLPLESLVATDLLPVDLVFSGWTFDDRGTGLPAPQSFEQLPNFAGTGRTLLRWRWNAGSGDLAVGSEVWIVLSTTVRSGAASGSLANDLTLEHDAPGLAQRCSGSTVADTLDYDGDSDTAEVLCREGQTINVAGIAQLISSKAIEGICDAGSTATSAGTLLGGAIEYTLRVENVGTVPLEDFLLVDILPFVGDTGVRDTSPRGSQWTPLLAAPIVPPPDTTLYYSTSGNPCRGEVGGPTVGCEPPNWTTVPPTPITSVRSFKVEFGDRVVDPSDFLEFTFLLTTPGDLAPGAVAYNSFAYQGSRSDGLGSLAAEPQKVGIAPGACEAAALGDFVWVDLDENGVQDDGPTGLDGVFVRLFGLGADGLPGTFDDLPLSSTLTGTGPGGAPGWYRFPGLAPGDYYVCVERPPTFAFTAPGVGSAELDSDADPTSGCSPVVILGSGETDLDTDFGLVATRFAALGNYAWFDRNADGLQNEPVSAGANGVSVRLLIDDGDGVAELGGDDVQAAATVTADDVHGRPGHYLFDGLVPGLRYLVQFVLPASATGFTAVDVGGDDTVDSDADPGDGSTGVVILAADQVDLSVDAGLVAAAGTLALGDQVWLDSDDDGLYEPQDGEQGIDGVRLDLYRDVNGDGEPTLDEYSGTTTTATRSGFAGRYRFDDLAAGEWIVVVASSNFAGGGALAGLISSQGNDPAPDPDDDVNGDDNGTDSGALTVSRPVTLVPGGEPTSEDGDADTNLTVDFGFVPDTFASQPEFDYGDAPDVLVGSERDDYRTTALDGGAAHRLGVSGAPILGSCVDADDGFQQNLGATADDAATFGRVIGVCSGSDDEDGVGFSGPFQPGGTATFTVSAAAGAGDCALDAWVDWDRSGVFGDAAGEQIASGLTVSAGATQQLTPAVPASAVPGTTYARFRCSSAGGLTPTGIAVDGEVEDHVVAIEGLDFGDAPSSYGTDGAGAASHVVDPGDPLLLGLCVDTEADGQPAVDAAGDDAAQGTSRIGSCLDDEDGVAFTGMLTACQPASVSVGFEAASNARLDAWIDFDGNGSFDEPGDRILSAVPVTPGSNVLGFTVPCTAVEGLTYARFRLSSSGGVAPTGAVADGEVEDYAVNVGSVDFGDAPDSYGTTFAAGGPNHALRPGFSLGATVDGESNGQPSPAADGDGADEDGINLPAGGVLTACETPTIEVFLTDTAGAPAALLDAWIDFDGDGAFDDPHDRIASGVSLVAGSNALPVAVPCDAGPAPTYARFRLSSTGVAGPLGPATDGEVEDWPLVVRGLDFGDAGGGYPTLLAADGARHVVDPTSNPTLGPTVDTEGDGQPTAGVDGDDLAGDDEDGVVLLGSSLVPGTDGSLRLSTGAVGGVISCWIDFSRDGDWSDAGEAVVVDLSLGAGAAADVGFPVPAGASMGDSALRCRIASSGGLAITGIAADGEVEDHPVRIDAATPGIGVAKRVVSIVPVPDEALRFTVTFEVRLENVGNVPLGDVNATAVFAAVFVSPLSWQLVDLSSAAFVVNPDFDGDADPSLLASGNALDPGAAGTITVVIEVDSAGEQGPFWCSSTGSGTPPTGPEVTDVSQDGGSVDPDDNDDPTDNGDPTPVEFPISVLAIPVADPRALALLVLLLAVVGSRLLVRG